MTKGQTLLDLFQSQGTQVSLPHFVANFLLAALALGALTSPVWASGSRPAANVADQVYITELGASGTVSIIDDDGDRVDWIEIANLGTRAVSLTGWSLTDSVRKPNRWVFPAVTLAAGQRVVVYASQKDRRDPARPLHANFKLDERGEYLALFRPDGRTIAHEFLPKYPRQRGAVTFGVREDLALGDGPGLPAGAHVFFERPTPGAPNAGAIRGLVAGLTANRAGGVVAQPFLLTFATRTTGARIVYTTDGSAPTETTGLPYRHALRIEQTTVVRAAAFGDGLAPTEILTRSFVFPEQVAWQSGAGLPSTWGHDTKGQPAAAAYALDRRVVEDPSYAADFIAGLRALPSLSVVTDVPSLFDATNGIYSHPTKNGPEWERAASAELLFPDGQPGFQIDCGLRVQGGWNRRPEESPKHSLRLIFKKQYGAPRLAFPLFGTDGAGEFETIILRAGCNNTWLHWSAKERRQGDYLRDQWMRDTAAAMGQPAARGRFVHLYLNGLYWGLYNVTERPSAPFLAAREGGKPGDYDSRNADKILEGDGAAWNRLFALANAGAADADAWSEIKRLLDVTAFADYMLLNFYGANADWDRGSNWYAGRRRTPPGPFRFFVWDGERTLEQVGDDRMDFDDDLSPSRLFHRLKTNAEFRALFADRVRLHCEGNGALSPRSAAERYRRLAATIDLAIVAESARWGSYRHDIHRYKEGPYERYTRDGHWRPEVQRLLNDYFPQRTDAFLRQLEARGLAATSTK